MPKKGHGRVDDFDISGAILPEKPIEVDGDKLNVLKKPRSTTCDILDTLNIQHSSTYDHVKHFDASDFSIIVSHEK